MIDKIILDDRTISDSQQLSETCNKYFCEVGSDLASKIINAHNQPSYYLGQHVMHTFFCSEITRKELLNALYSLKFSNAVACDQYSSAFVKPYAELIVEPLLHVYNLSFTTGIFPSELKKAKIPIYKRKGSKDNHTNYRPISLTSPFGKILEKLMHARVTNYLNKFGLLDNHQFGFRQNYSTTLTVLDVISMIQKELNNNRLVMGIFMDLQKAFDKVDLNILITKLEHYGIRGIQLEWFNSCLMGRTQVTSINGKISSVLMTQNDVPQGTVLGPLLFLIYTNDISNTTKNGKLRLFADDSNMFVVADCVNSLFSVANNEL